MLFRSEKTIWSRQKVLYRGKLKEFDIEVGAREIYDILRDNKVHSEDCEIIESMAKKALNTWMNGGLNGHIFTVQIEKRLSRETLLICVTAHMSHWKTKITAFLKY